MRLLIITNFALPFHTGGSEKIVQQVAETMANEFGWHVDVFCNYGTGRKIYNNVNVLPFANPSNKLFIDAVIRGNYDKIFIYGDLSTRLQAILENIHQIQKPIVLAAVGFNRMRSQTLDAKVVRSLFFANVNKLQIVVHSDDYLDSMFCKQHDIPYSVIHNSIDFTEFRDGDFSARNFYKLGNNKIILCVSNFFPGKGQENLIDIVRQLRDVRNDFVVVFVSSTLSYIAGNTKRDALEKLCRTQMLPIVFLNNIPREHVVKLYHESTFTVCPSEQEVGPIIILESMAAKKPWLSTNVGHVDQLRGGYFYPQTNGDKSKAVVFDDNMRNVFKEKIIHLLDSADNNRLGEIGYDQVVDEYNWQKVKLQYKKILEANEVKNVY